MKDFMNVKKVIILNYVSLAIMALSGLLINYIIARYYNSSTLGLYTEAYAWYMILSQIAVWGLHMAILKYIPETEDINEKESIMDNAIILSVATSGITILLSLIVILFIDIEWGKALLGAVLGLGFYSINKILLNFLNAINKMAIYAFIQMVRYSLLCILISIIATLEGDGNSLTLIFPLTEFIVSVILHFVVGNIRRSHINAKPRWDICKKLLLFGTKILPSNMVLELNSKVDIVCLGFFIKDTAAIGVYSFAILFTDGMYQLYITLRRILNPHIAKNNADGELKNYLFFLNNKSKKYLDVFSLLGLCIVILVYYLICRLIVGREYSIGLIYILIIGLSIVITGKQIILGDILAQTGFPLEESKLNTITVLFNFVLNLFLILTIGIKGAAIGTALSYICFAILLKRMCRARVSINI